MSKCTECGESFNVSRVLEDERGWEFRNVSPSFCPICGAGQAAADGVRAGMLRIGRHTWRVYIHPELSTSDIEFRDGAGNTLVIIKNLG